MVERNFTARERCFTRAGVKGHSGMSEQFLTFTLGDISMIQRGGIAATHLSVSGRNNSVFVKVSLVV